MLWKQIGILSALTIMFSLGNIDSLTVVGIVRSRKLTVRARAAMQPGSRYAVYQ